jgi:Chaperone of endosialidase
MQFNTIGSDNTASGLIALQSNTTGAEKTGLGAFALAINTTGKNNTAEGSGALANSTTGSNNVAVGFDAGFNLQSGGNNIMIGANVPGTALEANTIRIGKQGTQKSTFIAGIFGTAMSGSTVVVSSTAKLGVAASSARFKEAIAPMEQASESVLALKPVTFRYKE